MTDTKPTQENVERARNALRSVWTANYTPTGRIYTLQSETESAYYFDGFKGGWPKSRFVEVGPQ